MNPIQLRSLVRRALNEDIGFGDLTTEALVPEGHQSAAVLLTKQSGVIAGLPVVEAVFQELDPEVKVERLIEEGAEVEKGTNIARMVGPTRSIFTGERVALNYIQRLSGIATLTRQLVEQLEGLPCRDLDTRKTAPGLRMLEKYAVRIGSGTNRCFGLSHGVMIKDNHIAFTGSIKKAVEMVRKRVGHMVQIEVEVDNLEQLAEVLPLDVDAVFLDNMDPTELKEAVKMINGKVWTEASGGITPETIRKVAASGVDAVSLGWITHSAKALDISLDFEEKRDL